MFAFSNPENSAIPSFVLAMSSLFHISDGLSFTSVPSTTGLLLLSNILNFNFLSLYPRMLVSLLLATSFLTNTLVFAGNSVTTSSYLGASFNLYSFVTSNLTLVFPHGC